MPDFTNGNGEPPASTLAAQIVQNIEGGRDQPRGDNARAHLRELLQMILEGEDNSVTSQRAFDDTFEENYRLISVIVKACLEPISSITDDPFSDAASMYTQAKDSLAVIDLTIRRTPDVLFKVPGQKVPNGSPGGPLFLWLIPQIINLASTDSLEISQGLNKVLGSALKAQRKASALRYGRTPVFQYIKGCVRDILSSLKSETTFNTNNALRPYTRMPTTETLSEVFASDFGLDKTYPIGLKDAAQRVLVVSLLAMRLVTPLQSKASSKLIKVSTSNTAWIVDCILALWTSYVSESDLKHKNLPRILESLLQTLRISLSDLAKSKSDIVVTRRAAILSCKVLRKSLKILPTVNDSSLEASFCWKLVELVIIGIRHPSVMNIYFEHLDETVEDIAATADRLDAFRGDVQRTLVIVNQTIHHGVIDFPAELLYFDQSELRTRFEVLIEYTKSAISLKSQSSQRPHKKARVMTSYKSTPCLFVQETLDRLICQSLRVTYDPQSSGADLAIEAYKALDEGQQTDLFVILGQAACSNSSSQPVQTPCFFCDNLRSCDREKPLMDPPFCRYVYETFTRLLRIAQDQKTPRPRIIAMLSIRRVLNHCSISEFLDLRKSALGVWCYASLKSSIRDLRLAAITTLKEYVRDGLEDGIINRNRPIVLEHLRGLAEKNEEHLHETCILGFSQFISCVSNEEEVNIALLRLVEYLGNPNPLVCGIANEELLKTCKYDSVYAQRFFEPYWRSIAIIIVRNLQKRPQIAQSVCDILGIHVSEFLQRTQFYTIPYLVLTKQKEVLKRIAVATGPEHTIFSICISRAQLAAILSYLLLHAPGDVEESVSGLLNEVSPEFKSHDLSELLKTNCIYTAYELLKIAGEQEPAEQARARQILQFLANNTERKSSSSRSNKKQDLLSSFFETWALAIVQLLSEVISQAKGPQPLAERRRSIRALQEMSILAKNNICHTLPQICSCLRSAIEDKQLCNEALSAWMTLLKTLDEDYIVGLIDPTFAILAQHWNSFSETTQQEAYDIIEMLLKEHQELVRKIVETIPSIASIDLLSKFAGDIDRFRIQMDPKRQLEAFVSRCKNENDTVVVRALGELEEFLDSNQDFLQTTANSERPDPVVGNIIRSLLDACVRFKDSSPNIALRCARCLGLVGCVDPTRIEAHRDSPEMFVLSNFAISSETIDFIVFFLQEVLVKAYVATTITSRQQLLAFGMQELLRVCDFDSSVTFRRGPDELYKKWILLPESTRNILTPFLTSKYRINPMPQQPRTKYPLYRTGASPSHWLRTFTSDLLEKGQGQNAILVFDICRRLVRTLDIAIPSFLLPYVMLNVIVEGTDQQRSDIVRELFTVLNQQLSTDQMGREGLIECSQNVFRSIDYISRWIQEKEKSILKIQSRDRQEEERKVNLAKSVLKQIPPKVLSRRAIECKSFARALFHWEQYIREQEDKGEETNDLYEQLQEIYMQIDEPDGIEGISSCIQGLTMEQQILEDRKAGRWMAVQNWYELELESYPSDTDVQWNLLTSLRESGQHDVLLNQVSNFEQPEKTVSLWRPFAMEASWTTENWTKLESLCKTIKEEERTNFNIGIGRVILDLKKKDFINAAKGIEQLLLDGTRSLSETNTSSTQACHDTLLKFHILIELEAISGANNNQADKPSIVSVLEQRLELLGAFSSSKQYLLGVRRAAMALCRAGPSPLDISSTWLASAKLARKADHLHQAFNAVLHASHLNDTSATIEHARLTWHKGYHRKAIQSLKGAIDANAFDLGDAVVADINESMDLKNVPQRHNMVAAKAQLLLAKWMDGAGQTQSTDIVAHYRKVTNMHRRWDRGHYYLAKHYNKLLESEKATPRNKQAKAYLEGDLAKLCIENFLRSLPWGSKYLYQALPRILTLWLDFGAEVEQPVQGNLPRNLSPEIVFAQRKKVFSAVQKQMQKYIDRLPAYIFYTAFAQIVARICHPNQDVYKYLVEIVSRVVANHPQQAIWPLMAMINSKSSKDRAERGLHCKSKVLEYAKRIGGETNRAEINNLLNEGANLSKQLLQICNKSFEGAQAPRVPLSLSKDMVFNHSKAAPCRLVIPIEAALLANLPPATQNVRGYKPFSRDLITISVFLDEFTVLNSLIRPRKIKIRGSDGNVYALMCKPKDDLRKDQRLLEFNSTISRILKKDADCSKRRLYIRTYAVTPLNEEHGLVEWVDGLRTLRDIFIESYREKGITIDYGALRNQLNIISADHTQLEVFTRDILGTFKPVLHEWFVKQFPEPSAWLAARLRYTRSCAVMSMVGHVLGLGDRHGENILLEEAQGGTFHVDFNCLFDKGKTFETPERVPFRLTHNMVDAFGVYKENGPFRKSCELTLKILRQYEDTLMTILETFLYDPTTDFIGKKRRMYNPEVPDTPEGVLDNIRRKVRGMPPGESVPLSEEGYVQLQIDQARDTWNLARMYIGWCAFF